MVLLTVLVLSLYTACTAVIITNLSYQATVSGGSAFGLVFFSNHNFHTVQGVSEVEKCALTHSETNHIQVRRVEHVVIWVAFENGSEMGAGPKCHCQITGKGQIDGNISAPVSYHL